MIRIVENHSADPFFNAALEEYLLLHADTSNHDLLLLYENAPCVVVGKNQSLYKEINFEYLRSKPVVRRISGGGTVVHGPGNLCFAFISKFEEFKINNYRHFNQPIVDALQQRGIPATFNSRNDIVCREKKISGNAQFTNRRNILSHGTLLIDADLEKLRFALQPNSFRVESKAVSSVRSPVMNLSEISPFRQVNEWKEYLKEKLDATPFHLTPNDILKTEEISKQKMREPEWIYGRSPRTIIYKEGVTIAVSEGRVERISGPIISPDLENKLTGVLYTWNHISDIVDADLAKKIF